MRHRRVLEGRFDATALPARAVRGSVPASEFDWVVHELDLDASRRAASTSPSRALTTNVRALCGAGSALAPSALLFASDAGPVPALGFEQGGVTGTSVTPAQMVPDSSAQRGMVGEVAGGEHELA